MPESQLSLDYTYLCSRVGDYLGYNDDPDLFTEQQQKDVDVAIEDGIRSWYTPPRLPGSSYAHQWSFLKTLSQITTAADVSEYELPAEFGGIEGRLTVLSSSDSHLPIQLVHEGVIRAMFSAQPGAKGRITHASIEHLPAGRTRHRLLVFPKADAAYVLQFRMLIHGPKLSTDYPYPFGGVQHSQTILESCLAAAERFRGDMDGHHRAAFYERLAASVEVDKQQRPEYTSYMADPSTPESFGMRMNDGQYAEANRVSYNGTFY